jgi:hypothetical protein
LEFEHLAVIHRAIVRDNEVDVELIVVEKAKFLGGGRSAEERRKPITMEDMLRLQQAVSAADIVPPLAVHKIGSKEFWGKLG